MKKGREEWENWGARLRDHVRKTRIKWGDIASELGMTEGTVRHWCNGTREPNLSDFFKLCSAAQADPSTILFGGAHLTPEQDTQIIDTLAPITRSGTQPPTTSDRYRQPVMRSPPAAHQPLAATKYKRTATTKP